MVACSIDEQHWIALVRGYERVVAWSDLLDRINMFPVPDGDTGRNLVISLAPLHQAESHSSDLSRSLFTSARGNSGNIAASFLAVLLESMPNTDLAGAVAAGRDQARRAVLQPQPGTMLDLIDDLVAALPPGLPRDWSQDKCRELWTRMEDSVRATVNVQPQNQQRGVVDAGALGLWLFIEEWLATLLCDPSLIRSPGKCFAGLLQPAPTSDEEAIQGVCLDIVLPEAAIEAVNELSAMGQEVVVAHREGMYKLHLHAASSEGVRQRLAPWVEVLSWAEDDLARQAAIHAARPVDQQVHLVTDAAGSLTYENAAALGFSLQHSYVNLDNFSLPETRVDAASLYAAMRKGQLATTSQASVYEREQALAKTVEMYNSVLYLCVGSAYTGIYGMAEQWRDSHPLGKQVAVVDSGAAAGRLGLAAIAIARQIAQGKDLAQVIAYTHWTMEACREYIFIETLRYLAAGGRVPRAKAWIGQLLGMRPVVTTTPKGVVKVGAVRRQEDQIKMLTERLATELPNPDGASIMLQFTDNRPWIEDELLPLISRIAPGAEIILQPLSLTTGVHTGPGSWAVAFLPPYPAEGE